MELRFTASVQRGIEAIFFSAKSFLRNVSENSNDFFEKGSQDMWCLLKINALIKKILVYPKKLNFQPKAWINLQG